MPRPAESSPATPSPANPCHDCLSKQINKAHQNNRHDKPRWADPGLAMPLLANHA